MTKYNDGCPDVFGPYKSPRYSRYCKGCSGRHGIYEENDCTCPCHDNPTRKDGE